MRKDVFTYIVGGKAGEGVKKAGSVALNLFAGMGRAAFEMDDYPSLIKGGHNFSVVSTSPGEITSHYLNADLVVVHDERSYSVHESHLKENGIIVFNADEMERKGKGKGEKKEANEKEKPEEIKRIGIPMTSHAKKYPPHDIRLGVGSVAVLAAAIGVNREELKQLIQKEYPRDIEKNIGYAVDIYELIQPELGGTFDLEPGVHTNVGISGNQAVALGAVAAGLDVYFAYPMTPSTSILHFLARYHQNLGVVAVHPENEIAVANMAIGAAFAGAKTMVGSSGGGIALMEEAYSLAGMSEAPVLFVISSRSGPSTGVPTYTEQADLRFALNQGHGDIPRIVAAPGSITEAFYRAAEMLGLLWQFQTPGTLLLDRHLSESSHTVDIQPEKAAWAQPVMHKNDAYNRYKITENGVSPLLFPPSKELIKWNSYEHDELGITTDNAEKIVNMHDKRKRKLNTIIEHLKTLHTVNVYKNGSSVIFTYGSTTMSVLEALRAGDITATVVQPVYLEPFPVWEFESFSTGVVVEQSSTGQFATLLKEKAGIQSDIISQYDGRPFDPDTLARRLKEVL